MPVSGEIKVVLEGEEYAYRFGETKLLRRVLRYVVKREKNPAEMVFNLALSGLVPWEFAIMSEDEEIGL